MILLAVDGSCGRCDTAEVRVKLFGGVSVDVNGQPLTLGGPKQRGVFALLALHANQTVSLDRLVHEVWLDEPPAQATLALQSYISRLRRQLAKIPPSAEKAPRIVTRPPGWVLELPPEAVDVVAFADLIAQGHATMASGRPSDGAHLLRQALALWTGDPLADLSGTLRIDQDVARLTNARLDALELLFEADCASGDLTSVIRDAPAFLEANPYRERVWQALMLALYRSGRQSDALDAARELQRLLADELALEPSPQTRRLEEQILRQDPALEPMLEARAERSDRHEDERRIPAPDPALAESGAGQVFVGRGPEVAAVARAWGSSDRRGGLVVIEGPAGIGKSTILDRLEATAESTGGTVLRGAGVGASVMPALWAWVTIVRQIVVARPEFARRLRSGAAADALVLLDPSIGEPAASPGPVPADPRMARTQLYRAVVDLLARTQREGPIAVIVDDAQWLDEDSLSLLALAVEELVPQGVLFAVASRSEESPEVHDAIEVLGHGLRHAADRFHLTGLSVPEVGELIGQISGAPADAALAEAVHARSAGNPFFVTELVHLLISERRLDLAGVYELLPAGVRDVLRRRIDRLPEQTVTLLSVASLVTGATDVELLGAVTGLTEDAVLDAAEAAVLVGLLVDDGGRFSLSHDLVRQTVRESLSGARRCRLHARIARALQDAEPHGGLLLPEQVIELAHHLTEASAAVEPAAAVPYLLIAADDALARLAFDQAERFLATAAEQSEQVTDPVKRTEVERQIEARAFIGRFVSPQKTNTTEWTTGSRLLSSDTVLPLDHESPAAWVGALAFLIVNGDLVKAAAAAEEVDADILPVSTAGVVHLVRGTVHTALGLVDVAEGDLIRSEDMLAQVPGGVIRGMFPVAGFPTAQRAAVAALRGDDATAEALLAQARATPDQVPVQRSNISFWGAWCAAQANAPRLAAERAATCIELAAASGDTFYTPPCDVIQGWSRAVLGDPLGLQQAEAAHRLYLAGGMHYLAPLLLTLRAEAHAWHGDLDTARDLVLQARAIAELTCERALSPRLISVAQQLVPLGTGHAHLA